MKILEALLFIGLVAVIFVGSCVLVFRHKIPQKSLTPSPISEVSVVVQPKTPDFLASDSLIAIRAKHLKTPKRAAKFYASYERELKALIKYNEEKVIAPLRLKLQDQKRFTSTYQKP